MDVPNHPNDASVNAVAFFIFVLVLMVAIYATQVKPGGIQMPPSIARYMRKRRTKRVCNKHSFELNTGELAVVDNNNCEVCTPPKPEPPPKPPLNVA
jgi:hypothetical protein